MNPQKLLATAYIVAVGVTVVSTIKTRKDVAKRNEAIRAHNSRLFQREMRKMAISKEVTDRVLDGEYGTNFMQAYRDITWRHRFEDITARFDD